MADPRRIDVHHHVTPPSYIKAASQITYGNAPRMSWSLERSLEDMDKGGVATSIISLPHPVTIWPAPKDEQRALARDWNEFVARMAKIILDASGSSPRCRSSTSKAALRRLSTPIARSMRTASISSPISAISGLAILITIRSSKSSTGARR